MHGPGLALAHGPPDEPTIAALRSGVVALAGAYFEPDLLRAGARIALQEPVVAAAGPRHAVRRVTSGGDRRTA